MNNTAFTAVLSRISRTTIAIAALATTTLTATPALASPLQAAGSQRIVEIKRAQCPWSTHGQTGACITLLAVPTDVDDQIFTCPTTHPYVFLAAFSNDPHWEDMSDSSVFGDLAWGTVQPTVRTRKEAGTKRSYVGGVDDPGWVHFTWKNVDFGAGGEPQWAATYACAQRSRQD